MQTLHVRSVPDQLYAQLQELAQSRQRSLSAQVILMLDRALQDELQRQEQATVLAEVRRRRFIPDPEAPTGEELLRQDRER